MRRRNIQVGRLYQARSINGAYTVKILYKGLLTVRVKHKAQWDYGWPLYTTYGRVFYWNIMEEKE